MSRLQVAHRREFQGLIDKHFNNLAKGRRGEKYDVEQEVLAKAKKETGYDELVKKLKEMGARVDPPYVRHHVKYSRGGRSIKGRAYINAKGELAKAFNKGIKEQIKAGNYPDTAKIEKAKDKTIEDFMYVDSTEEAKDFIAKMRKKHPLE